MEDRVTEFVNEDGEAGPDDTLYFVVINAEEQYSIWRSDRKVPEGWSTVGDAATKTVCLDFIEEHWTDMRPLSARSGCGVDSPE